MLRAGFAMQLKPGNKAEYKRRHDEIWPELNELLRTSGISDYTIFLEEASLQLFAVQKLADNHTTDQLSQNPLVKKWCEYMSDIVLMDSSGNPISTPLPRRLDLTSITNCCARNSCVAASCCARSTTLRFWTTMTTHQSGPWWIGFITTASPW